MLTAIRSLSTKLGVDGAIAYTVLSRVIQASGGVISIIFIAKYLSLVEQGYYYTFGSVLAIQIFFELGLSNIITQFVAHEMAHLSWKSQTQLEGSEESLSRLSSLLHFCVKWFAITAAVLLVALVIIGYGFFTKYGKDDVNLHWQTPWLLLSVTTACSLLISPILAYFEGLNKVKEVAVIRLVQQSFQLFLLLVFLTCGFKLYASPLAALMAFTIAPIWIFYSYKKHLLKNIWLALREWRVNYKLEIFPYQWRIALSWISGYFIFQLFNPVLFATEGSEVAGQMGMSLAALGGILSISMSWFNTKVPAFSTFIAKKEYKSLDSLFIKTLKQASSISLAGLTVFVVAILVLQHYNVSLAFRFLPVPHLILLSAATFANQFISGFATYLRCHKQEPFLITSIVMGCLTAASTIGLGKLFGLSGIVIGYSTLTVFVSLTWAIIIFRQKKQLWHQQRDLF